MLKQVKHLIGKKLTIRDQTLGEVGDMLIDDSNWQMRYWVCVVPATQKQWLFKADALKSSEKESGYLAIKLRHGNIIDADKVPPVSRQKKKEMQKYEEWPLNNMNLDALSEEEALELAEIMSSHSGLKNSRSMVLDEHLRSVKEIMGYRIDTVDDEFGHVDDFIIDDSDWLIRYVVIDSRNWLPGGKRLLLPVTWIEDIMWSDNTIKTAQSREKLEECPEFEDGQIITTEQEVAIFKHYGGHL